MGSQSSPKQHDKLLIKVLSLLNLEQEDHTLSLGPSYLSVRTCQKKWLKAWCLQVSSSETQNFFSGILQTSREKQIKNCNTVPEVTPLKCVTFHSMQWVSKLTDMRCEKTDTFWIVFIDDFLFLSVRFNTVPLSHASDFKTELITEKHTEISFAFETISYT